MIDSRRSFLRLILLAAVAPSILIAGATDKAKWKKSISGLWKPNPAWAKAEYEAAFICDDECYNRMPFYLAKQQIEANPRWLIWNKMLEPIKWQPGAGNVMQRIETFSPESLAVIDS